MHDAATVGSIEAEAILAALVNVDLPLRESKRSEALQRGILDRRLGGVYRDALDAGTFGEFRDSWRRA